MSFCQENYPFVFVSFRNPRLAKDLRDLRNFRVLDNTWIFKSPVFRPVHIRARLTLVLHFLSWKRIHLNENAILSKSHHSRKSDIGNYNRENLPNTYRRHIFILKIKFKRELVFSYLDILWMMRVTSSPDNES